MYLCGIMKNMDKITLSGKFWFDPANRTKKQNNQSSWKRIAMVIFNTDVVLYYQWFLLKRYNLTLVNPLRGGHITVINDSLKDLTHNGKIDVTVVDEKWNNLKNKYNGMDIDCVVSPEVGTNGEAWWLRVEANDNPMFCGVRSELGLGNPYFPYHLSLGYANNKQIEHSQYIKSLYDNGFIQ